MIRWSSLPCSSAVAVYILSQSRFHLCPDNHAIVICGAQSKTWVRASEKLNDQTTKIERWTTMINNENKDQIIHVVLCLRLVWWSTEKNWWHSTTRTKYRAHTFFYYCVFAVTLQGATCCHLATVWNKFPVLADASTPIIGKRTAIAMRERT